MNDFRVYLLEAMVEADENYHKNYTNDAWATVNCAMTLMQLDAGGTKPDGTSFEGWSELLEQQKNKYLMSTLSGNTAQAKVDQAIYEQMTTKSDQQKTSWQAIVGSKHFDVEQDGTKIEDNYKLVEDVMSTTRFGMNLAKKKL